MRPARLERVRHKRVSHLLETKATNNHMRIILALAFIFVTSVLIVAQDNAGVGFVIAVDNSKSMAPDFPQILRLGRLLVEKKAQQEQVSLVRFIDSAHIETVENFTDDAAKLREAFELLYTDLGQSAVLDTVFLSAEAAGKRGPRTSVVLVTDGEDRASFYKAERVYSKLRELHVRVFTVGLVNRLEGKYQKRAMKLLSDIAEQSGGRAFFIDSEAEIPGVANALLELIRR
jgi:Ca-activated chloride channel homolog